MGYQYFFEKLNEEIKRLNQKISTLEHQLLNQPPKNENPIIRKRPSQRLSSSKKGSQIIQPKKDQNGYVAMDIYNKIEKAEEDARISKIKSGDKLLSELVHFCMAKKIDIKQHLRSYDTSKNGRLTDDNFMKAIIELKTSFTENDIREIIKISKPKDEGDIIIDEFIELMKKKDYNFKVKEDVEINNDNKQASKKYDLFANKPYNIDYP